MADETLAIRHDEIGAVDTAKLAHGTRGIVLLDTDGNTKAATPREVTDAAGVITIGGIGTGAAAIGATLDFQLINNGVAMGKLAQIAGERLMGNPTASAANVQAFGIGPGLVFSAGVLDTVPSIGASDAAPMYDYERFGAGSW